MSITSVTLSGVEPSLLHPSNASNAKATTSTAGGVAAAVSEDSSLASNAVTALTKDLTSLLKSLISGNVSDAEADLAGLQAELNSQYPSVTLANTANTNSAVTSNPLITLLAGISKSLTNGNTEGALRQLAAYLVSTGVGTGNLVNTTA